MKSLNKNKLNENIIEISMVIITLLSIIVSIYIFFEHPKKINKPKKVISNQSIQPTAEVNEKSPIQIQNKSQQINKPIQQKVMPKNKPKPKESEVRKSKKPYVNKFDAVVTFYTAYEESTNKTPNHPAFGITASGRKVKQGVTAACPPHIPLGTWIEIEGFGKRRCDDRGGAIKGNKIDIYVEKVSEAIKLGKQKRTVYILE